MYKCLNCNGPLEELVNPGDYSPSGIYGCSVCRYPHNRYVWENRELVQYEVKVDDETIHDD